LTKQSSLRNLQSKHASGILDIEVSHSRFVSDRLSGISYNETYSSLGPFAMSPKNGDCNSDLTIDLTDYTIVATAFNAIPDSSNWDPTADLNNDGVVDLTDYTFIAVNFFSTSSNRYLSMEGRSFVTSIPKLYLEGGTLSAQLLGGC
jgi:hypothetical protein